MELTSTVLAKARRETKVDGVYFVAQFYLWFNFYFLCFAEDGAEENKNLI